MLVFGNGNYFTYLLTYNNNGRTNVARRSFPRLDSPSPHMRTRPFLFSFQTFHSFDEETATMLRSRQHWEKFGNYLVSDFVIESTNEPLAENGVITNLRIMIGKASEKFKLSSFEDGMFYSCLASTVQMEPIQLVGSRSSAQTSAGKCSSGNSRHAARARRSITSIMRSSWR